MNWHKTEYNVNRKKSAERNYLHNNEEFTFSNVNVIDQKKITGLVTNNSDKDAFIDVAVILKKDGSIIRSYSTNVGDISAGGTQSFELGDFFEDIPSFDEAVISIVSW